jgi:hypothetical protein
MPATVKGALIELIPGFVLPVPNVIVFQINPDTMTHTWTQPAAADAAVLKQNPLAVKGDPKESFKFTLKMDAEDTIARGNPVASGIAVASGVYSRLSALERLQYPVPAKKTDLVGSVSVSVSVGGAAGAAAGAALGGGGAAQATQVPTFQLPTVLFVWGPWRVLPVKVKDFAVTEKKYDFLLNPTQVEASISLDVLTQDELKALSGGAELAQVAYAWTDVNRLAFAAENVANTADAGPILFPF